MPMYVSSLQAIFAAVKTLNDHPGAFLGIFTASGWHWCLTVGAECTDQVHAVHELLHTNELETAQLRRENEELRRGKAAAQAEISRLRVALERAVGSSPLITLVI